MRRTLLFTAGLIVAAGTSLALAGPASAAPSGCCSYPSYPTYNTSLLSPNTNVQLANLSSVILAAMITTAECPGSSRCSTRLRDVSLAVGVHLDDGKSPQFDDEVLLQPLHLLVRLPSALGVLVPDHDQI